MGIKGLENFVAKWHPGIAENISIRDEITNWRKEHNADPTIVVDFQEFLRVFAKIDEGGLILGGRPTLLNDIFEYFFGEMKRLNANLVFVGRVCLRRYNNIEEFFPPDRSFECIKRHESLQLHLKNQRRINQWNTLYPIERLWYNVMTLCKKYGQIDFSHGFGRGTVLANIRRKNAMALITRDTEFLIFEGDFQFWTVSELDLCDLRITRFCRQKLKEALDLNTDQMKLLFVISQFDPKTRSQIWGQSNGSFVQCISYVKQQQPGPNGYDITQLEGRFTDEQLEESNKEWDGVNFIEKNAESEQAHLRDDNIADLIKSDPNFNELFQFCKRNLYYVFKLMCESLTSQKDILLIDLRRPDAGHFMNIMADISLKLCGIIFKDIDADERPKTRAVYVKGETGEKGEVMEKDIKYPPNTLPSLKELIIQEDETQFTDSRWSLFSWLLDVDPEIVAQIRNSSNLKHIRLVLFTQKLLLKNQLITNLEADVILHTEKESQTKSNVYVPKNRPSPPMPNERFPNYVEIDWVIAAHKYTIAFELVCHCLEICGLRKETSLIVFNALKFHENMYEMENNVDNMLVRRLRIE